MYGVLYLYKNYLNIVHFMSIYYIKYKYVAITIKLVKILTKDYKIKKVHRVMYKRQVFEVIKTLIM